MTADTVSKHCPTCPVPIVLFASGTQNPHEVPKTFFENHIQLSTPSVRQTHLPDENPIQEKYNRTPHKNVYRTKVGSSQQPNLSRFHEAARPALPERQWCI